MKDWKGGESQRLELPAGWKVENEKKKSEPRKLFLPEVESFEKLFERKREETEKVTTIKRK